MKYDYFHFDSPINFVAVAEFCIYKIYYGLALNKGMISHIKNDGFIQTKPVRSQVYYYDLRRIPIIRVSKNEP